MLPLVLTRGASWGRSPVGIRGIEGAAVTGRGEAGSERSPVGTRGIEGAAGMLPRVLIRGGTGRSPVGTRGIEGAAGMLPRVLIRGGTGRSPVDTRGIEGAAGAARSRSAVLMRCGLAPSVFGEAGATGSAGAFGSGGGPSGEDMGQL